MNNELIFHSDRGIQYAYEGFVTELDKHKTIKRSISRKDNCWNNAAGDFYFKSLKVELVYQHNYETKQQADISIFEFIETFYNTMIRHKKLNNSTILEYQNLITNNSKNAD